MQKLHAKVEVDKVQSLIGEIRQEVQNNISTTKKDQTLKAKKKEEELKNLKIEFENGQAKGLQDLNSMNEKLQRLAAQFDKELMARDKQMKQFKNMSQEDVQRSFAALSTDIEMSRKQLNDLEIRKADKRELLDHKQKSQLSLDQKIDKAEVHGIISDFTKDQAQKSFGFRKELFEKISDIQQDIASSVSQFVQISELNKLLDEKADNSLVQRING